MSAKEEPKKARTAHTLMFESGRRAVQRGMRRERMRPDAVIASMKKWRHDLLQMSRRMSTPEDARMIGELRAAIAEWGDSYPRAQQIESEAERFEEN